MTMDDLISRQAAIDAIRASTSKYTGFMEMEMYTDDDAVEAIEGLPSAQPKVIRCKDCKQCRKTILFGHFATVCDYWIKLTDDDGYCNHAERKES